MKYQRRIYRFLICTVVPAAIIFASNAFIVHADDDPLVDTVEIERRVSTRFKLSSKEMRSIRSLIRSDNRNVVRLYWNASEEQRSNYMSLWDKIRQGRKEFEASLDPTFSNRQKAALRMAHTEFESRILYMWLEDYLDFLGGTLELDNVQANMVRFIFENEQDRRHQALIQAGPLQNLLDPKWDQLSKNRDAQMNLILDADQRRVYRSLFEITGELIA